ncbi:MAG: preprotein translocase subunit SecE [Desulfobacterales bacterium]|nr:preprotein translocase subunit SecE [Desulfobacterales bacterium]
MARLQKRKPVTKKKKPRQSESGETAGENQTGGRAAPPTGTGGPGAGERAKDKKPNRALSAKKVSPAGQSAILRLIDRYFGNWIQFLREVKIELSKVTWPTRKQIIGSTVVVIVFVFIIAMFLGLVDIGLSSIIRVIL